MYSSGVARGGLGGAAAPLKIMLAPQKVRLTVKKRKEKEKEKKKMKKMKKKKLIWMVYRNMKI